jgi:outer membrane protein assembly factor BamE
MKYLTPIKTTFSLFIALLLLNGCLARPFKFPIHQGNLLTNKQIVQVRNGMTTDQIQYLLGTPMLQDIFHPDEWHYVYYEKQAYKAPVLRKVIISFENNRVSNIDRSQANTPTV